MNAANVNSTKRLSEVEQILAEMREDIERGQRGFLGLAKSLARVDSDGDLAISAVDAFEKWWEK